MQMVKFEAHRYEMGDLIVDAIPSDIINDNVDYFLSVKGEYHKMYMTTSDRLSLEAEERLVVSMIANENQMYDYWQECEAIEESYKDTDFGEACEGCNGDGQCDDDYDCCMHCDGRDCLVH